MLDDLLSSFQALDKAAIEQSTLEELEDVCKNPVFRMLCDICNAMYPKQRK
jgi:hypothetical protein